MNNESETAFEQRLRDILDKTGEVAVPPLTVARLTALRALIPPTQEAKPLLSLVWESLANASEDVLRVVKTVGMAFEILPSPLVRDVDGGVSRIEMITCPLPNGELKAQVISSGSRKAKLVLSIKGDYIKRNDLSVELSLGQRLLEARPLEQKAEVTLDGTGLFIVKIFAGEEIIGEMNLDIAVEDKTEQ